MKITSFNPLIVTKNAEAAIALFEDLGFERRHTNTVESSGHEIVNVSMKDANGFCVDIAEAGSIPQDLTIIRMNVDDFDKAYEELLAKGFRNSKGNDQTVDTKTNKSAMMISPSGFAFDLCQHIKD